RGRKLEHLRCGPCQFQHGSVPVYKNSAAREFDDDITIVRRKVADARQALIAHVKLHALVELLVQPQHVADGKGLQASEIELTLAEPDVDANRLPCDGALHRKD